MRDNGENITVMDDLGIEKFVEEIGYLMKLEHQNIVKLVGYAFEISMVLINLNGETVLARDYQRAICMDYLPNGSLEVHLTGMLLCIPLYDHNLN